MAAWTDRRRTLWLALLYAAAITMIVAFLLRTSFAVPNFIYQNF